LNALLYEPGDRAKLAGHMSTLLDDRASRSEMAAASPIVWRSLTSFEETCRAWGEILREASLSSVPATESQIRFH
jgi:hypothetical protein